MRNIISFSLLLIGISSCAQKSNVDLLITNAKVYTVDNNFSTAEAIAVKDGKIVDVGTNTAITEKYSSDNKLDAKGKFIYPGFIDAHAHFFGYGSSLQTANLVGTSSWEEIIEKLKTFAQENPEGWLRGRGWDQNDWQVKEFPDNKKLNELFPDRPVILTRVDGHAAIANQKALDLAGLKPGNKIQGGEIVAECMQPGENCTPYLTGLLVDNGVDLVTANIPGQTKEQFRKSLKDAEKNCLAVGLTTIDDCGLGFETVEGIKQMHANGELKMRLYVMLSDEKKNFDYLEKNGAIKTERLNVRSFKVYGDGALGSRGACLLKPYSDKPNNYGFLLSSKEHFDSVANWISAKGFQMCTHAIGDSGNRTILNIYGKYLKGKNDQRWRIEHAQVVNQNDFNLFGKYNIIPSVQPTHATSDMYWAGVRLGPERVKGAYAFKQLLDQNGWIPLGTDFPVEDISPFKTFYAAVFRKDEKNFPADGYQMENALSREAAIRGMTIWAARSNFEETEKGSLEKGKLADFIILDRDLMKVNENEILSTSVLATYINGEKVYEKK